MSARQAFIPRPPSRISSSEPHPQPTDARTIDGDKDILANGNGRARSISAFLGQKRGATDTVPQGAGPTQGAGLGRMHTTTPRRSFEGILRPEMMPMSIIPYPATTQLGTGTKQPGAGQTPRKTTRPGVFEFSRPMTPLSMPRGHKKGLGISAAENRDDDATSNGNVNGSGVMSTGPEDEADLCVVAGTGIGGYMRVFEGSGGFGSAGGLQSSLERDVAAPVPEYAFGGVEADPEDGGYDIEGVFPHSSRSLGAMVEERVGPEDNNNSQRGLGGTKRRLLCEDTEESGRHSDEGHRTQGSGKRMKQVHHNPDEYFPISSPHIPPTPRPQTASIDTLDPSLVAGSLLENIEEFVNLELIEAEWKRWKECTTEEWLKGADVLAQEYTDVLNMVKDHMTEKVLAYASMISSVEEKRTEVNRNIEIIHGKWNTVRENISKLGTKK